MDVRLPRSENCVGAPKCDLGRSSTLLSRGAAHVKRRLGRTPRSRSLATVDPPFVLMAWLPPRGLNDSRTRALSSNDDANAT
jgi:hypothetical protein